MKNIVFFDLDGTLIKGQSQKYLITYLYKQKLISTYRLALIYLWFIGYKLNIFENPKRPLNIAFKVIEGKSIDEVKSIMHNFFEIVLKQKINNHVFEKLKDYQARGDEVILLSTAVRPVAQAVGDRMGIKNIISTKLELSGRRYTGRVDGEIIYGGTKKKLAKKELENNAGQYNKSIAYFDHISDIVLADVVDQVIVVRPQKDLCLLANNNNWQIIS